MKRTMAVILAAAISMGLPTAAFGSTDTAITAGSANGSIAMKTQAISEHDALSVALKDANVKKSQVTLVKTEDKGSTFEVEFVKKKDATEFEYEISMVDGAILEKSVDYVYEHNSSKDKIGRKTALKRAARATGVKRADMQKVQCKYKYKKREGKYVVKFRSDGYKYECDLLAPTGKVIEWEMERLGG